ncbi:hypothetical protein Bpfe_028002, partial [Biomphalaria pfeifferi]
QKIETNEESGRQISNGAPLVQQSRGLMMITLMTLKGECALQERERLLCMHPETDDDDDNSDYDIWEYYKPFGPSYLNPSSSLIAINRDVPSSDIVFVKNM